MALLEMRRELRLQLLGQLGRCTRELGVPVLLDEEFQHIACEFFPVKAEGVLALPRQGGIVSVEGPVPAVNGLLLVQGHLREASLRAVLDARRVADHDRRTVVLLGLLEGLHRLLVVCTDGARSHVDVPILHENGAEILFRLRAAALRELCHGAHGSGLGGLPARVAVHLRVEDADPHVVAAREHVVDAAVPDVVGPTVATKHPHGRLHEHVLQPEHLGDFSGSRFFGFQQGHDLFREFFRDDGILRELHPLLEQALQLHAHRSLAFGQSRLDAVFELEAPLLHREKLPEAELCVVLEQRVPPRHAAARRLVFRVRDPARGAAPNAAAARRVGDNEPLPEHLRDQLRVGRLSTTLARAGELHKRLLELRALEREGIEARAPVGHGHRKLPHGLVLVLEGLREGGHRQGIRGARVRADLATSAIERRGLDPEMKPSV
mmetsp:Transcript_107443/g.302327  ORF Transcript_107443/g.302327 Transcript_107443/m.302327 type:complete len:436 (-) Transcript_107443:2373-3680(-)